MKKLIFFVLALLWAWTASALDYTTIDVRRTGNSPVRESFWAGDDVAFGYEVTENGSPLDLSGYDYIEWMVCTYTNPAQCWMSVVGDIDDAENGEVSVTFWGYKK